MSHRGTPFPALVLAALVAAQAQAATDSAPPPATDPADSPNCLNLQAIRSTKVLDDRTILFEMSGSKSYVNRLPNRCPGLKFEKRFLYKTSLNQLCGQDIITVLTDVGRGASCGLGKFEAWVEPEHVDDQGTEVTLEPDKSE